MAGDERAFCGHPAVFLLPGNYGPLGQILQDAINPTNPTYRIYNKN